MTLIEFMSQTVDPSMPVRLVVAALFSAALVVAFMVGRAMRRARIHRVCNCGAPDYAGAADGGDRGGNR